MGKPLKGNELISGDIIRAGNGTRRVVRTDLVRNRHLSAILGPGAQTVYVAGLPPTTVTADDTFTVVHLSGETAT